MYEKLIPIEIDTLEIEKHTYIQTYMSIQENVKIDTNWKSSMIPIDITIKAWYNSYQNEEYELVKMEIFVN